LNKTCKGEQSDDVVVSMKQKFLDFQNTLLHENKHVQWTGPGEESVSNVEERALAGLQQLMVNFPDCNQFCIVAHGRFNKLLLRALLGLSGYNSLEQGNACINVLDVDQQGNWKARIINHMGHVVLVAV
jgi:broad specificity phosphatase PhoE